MDPFDVRSVAAGYDVVADDYLEAFGEDLQRLPLDRAVLDALASSITSGGVVLDLGCGPGQVGDYLSERGLEVVGIDVSQRMLVTSRQRTPPGRAVAGDMRRLPVRSGSCGGVVAFYSIHHLRRADLEAALGEIGRVLSPGSTLVVATHIGDGEVYVDEFLGHRVAKLGGSLYREEELRAALERTSFVLDDVRFRDPLDHEYPSRRIYISARTQET